MFLNYKSKVDLKDFINNFYFIKFPKLIQFITAIYIILIKHFIAFKF